MTLHDVGYISHPRCRRVNSSCCCAQKRQLFFFPTPPSPPGVECFPQFSVIADSVVQDVVFVSEVGVSLAMAAPGSLLTRGRKTVLVGS